MNAMKTHFLFALFLFLVPFFLWAKGDIAKGKAKAKLSTAKRSSSAKGDIAKGKAKSVTCTACHGPKGISLSPIWPNLAGQKKEYLIKQIKAFKSGVRKDPSMAPMVAPLTEDDIKNLAAYYSSLKCSP